MQNNQKTTTPQKETGITKAMPIILGAISLFIAVCLIFGNAGAFGAAISSFLRGLFASGAYAIPIVILLHAMCFKSDYADKRILSRAVLSFITILIVSSIDYTVSNILCNRIKRWIYRRNGFLLHRKSYRMHRSYYS